jgi:hypothetical protein
MAVITCGDLCFSRLSVAPDPDLECPFPNGAALVTPHLLLVWGGV